MAACFGRRMALSAKALRLKVVFAGGSYNYLSGTTEITGTQLLTDVMPGWRFKGDHYEAMIFGGVELQSNTFVPDDPGNRLRGVTGRPARRRRHLVSAE